MLDLLIKNAFIGFQQQADIAVKQGRIQQIAPQITAPAQQTIEASGLFASAPFVDSHFHMDATLSLGQPRLNRSGTLLEGIALWSELKPDLTVEAIKQRALELCRWSIAQGTLAIRSHVDICDDRLLAVDALLEVKREMAPYLDLQLVAFPQDGYLRSASAQQNLLRALDKGVEVVGGIPHFERTQAEGARSIQLLCELAAERGLRVDMHCDESDDPHSRHVETLAFETQRLGLEGRVTGSHLTSMHSMDNYYVSKLLPLMREAKLHVVANPLINITLQGRSDSYPKRRGMTRVPELMAAGINVAFGQDCIMDPWYSFGTHDMLDVAHMGLHIAQMTSIEGLERAYKAVTDNGAQALGLEGYGLEAGKFADIVLLQATSPIEALQLRPARRYVIRRGQIIAQTPAAHPTLELGQSSETVNFSRQIY